MKQQLCEELIADGKVRDNDVLRHSYTSAREKDAYIVANNMSPTLDTRADCFGVVVKDVKTVGNYSPSGHNATRIVDPDGVSPTVMENHGQVTAITEDNVAIVDDLYANRADRTYKDASPALRSGRSGLKVVQTENDKD